MRRSSSQSEHKKKAKEFVSAGRVNLEAFFT
jgi:hypothetical protein